MKDTELKHRREVLTLLFGFLFLASFFSNEFAGYVQVFISIFSGGTSGQKMYMFFLFGLAPLLASYFFQQNKTKNKTFVRYVSAYLVLLSLLYLLGFAVFSRLCAEYDVPLKVNYMEFNRGEFTANLNVLAHHHLLKPTVGFIFESIGISGIMRIHFASLTEFIPVEVYYLSSLLYLAAFYCWIRIGILFAKDPVDYILLSLPAYGIFVTSIDGGFFTYITVTSMGAFLAYIVYYLKKNDLKKIFLIYVASLIPLALMCVLWQLFFNQEYFSIGTSVNNIMYSSVLLLALQKKNRIFDDAIKQSNIKQLKTLRAYAARQGIAEEKTNSYLGIYLALVFLIIALIPLGIEIYSSLEYYKFIPEKEWNATASSEGFANLGEEQIIYLFKEKGILLEPEYIGESYVFGVYKTEEDRTFRDIKKTVNSIDSGRTEHKPIDIVTEGEMWGLIGHNQTIIIESKEAVTDQDARLIEEHPLVLEAARRGNNSLKIKIAIKHNYAALSVLKRLTGGPYLIIAYFTTE
ncbi:MAG: hypothetical protein WAX07_02190 [Candidatus Altiarchaeia archaeon]